MMSGDSPRSRAVTSAARVASPSAASARVWIHHSVAKYEPAPPSRASSSARPGSCYSFDRAYSVRADSYAGAAFTTFSRCSSMRARSAASLPA